MKIELASRKEEKQSDEENLKNIEVKKNAPKVPKLEFLGNRIESHIDPRMNDPEYKKKQLEALSKF